MKNRSYPQYAILSENSASALTEKLNETLRTINDDNVTVEFEGLIARVRYTEKETGIPESLSDEYSIKGVSLTCSQCPYFKVMLKKDGTPDERKKVGCCPFAKRGVTFKDSPACDILFQALNNGEVTLCLAH